MVQKNLEREPLDLALSADYEEAQKLLKERIGNDIFIGLLMRSATTVVFAILLGLFAFGTFTKLPNIVSDLLNRFFY
jgi:hypothetical protein